MSNAMLSLCGAKSMRPQGSPVWLGWVDAVAPAANPRDDAAASEQTAQTRETARGNLNLLVIRIIALVGSSQPALIRTGLSESVRPCRGSMATGRILPRVNRVYGASRSRRQPSAAGV